MDYTVLHKFAQDKNISYNELCATVNEAIAAPSSVSAEPLYSRQYEGMDGIDYSAPASAAAPTQDPFLQTK